MKDPKDMRYKLTTLWRNEAQVTSDFKQLKWQIEDNGSFNIKTLSGEIVKLYSPEFAFVMLSTELPVFNLDTKENIVLNVYKEFLQIFIKAFEEGENHFDKEFAIDTKTLYGTNAELYVRDIHYNYYHSIDKGACEGWQFVKKSYPLTLTKGAVKDHGFYSGIVSRVDAMVMKYPKLFQTFDKCELQEHPKQALILDNLFCDSKDIEPAISILRQIEPPLISEQNTYLGGYLGGFSIWLNELSKRDIIQNLPTNDAIVARMLEAKFKNLIIAKDGSSLRKPSIRAEKLYKQDIQVILSQLSQSGKIGK